MRWMFTHYTFVALVCWWALALVWLPGYFLRLRARKAPTPYPAAQIVAPLLLYACFFLMFAGPRLGFRLLLTPRTPALGVLGDILAVAGVAFAIWARLTLGRNWSGLIVSVREGQGLVQHGPYAIVRHPIYTGFICAMVGTALTIGTLASWIGVASGTVALLIRAEIEDRMMAAEFGDAHAAYRARTKKLIPFVW
ncbi:MAG TPA: isoprenylcysteine carboxylmethyltransferase family protein [Xanthobacteraceae bacterium]|nr:isoprenylcysteine carboxylmethyltransferase family protein [Xanthobacteraceae bacterium]